VQTAAPHEIFRRNKCNIRRNAQAYDGNVRYNKNWKLDLSKRNTKNQLHAPHSETWHNKLTTTLK